jgi:hypothetical protein
MLHQKHPHAAILAALITAFIAGDYFDSIHLARVAIVKTSLMIATAVSEPEQPSEYASVSKVPVLAFGGAK